MASQEAFTEAYEQHADAIFRFCYLRVYDRELAKELMQESFMKAWTYCKEGKKVDQLKPFLFTIAGNLIIDHSRRKKLRKIDSLEALLENGFEPGEEGGQEKQTALLDAQQSLEALNCLKSDYREILKLRYLNDLSLKEIAQILNIKENLVSVRLNRALKKLRKHLKP